MDYSKKKKISKVIFIIILIILVIIIAILNNKSKVNENNVEYDNLNINNNELNIFYLNVGQGDSTLLTINGYTMLIDSGNDSDGYYISQFLKSQNYYKIDYFIVTHFDEDHMGGAYKILEEFDIGTLYMPNDESETKTYQKFIETISKYDINTNTNLIASNDITYSLGNANWKILNINGNTSNDSSIVIELDYINTKYLFMADSPVSVENNLECENIDVLKVAHHGSNTSTSEQFLDKITPKYAIISVGANNSYGFPKQEILERLKTRKIEVYRTDLNGTIWITSNGKDINVKTLNYNLDGVGRKHASIFKRKYLHAFFLL
jgi:competence protein ComEC